MQRRGNTHRGAGRKWRDMGRDCQVHTDLALQIAVQRRPELAVWCVLCARAKEPVLCGAVQIEGSPSSVFSLTHRHQTADVYRI